MHFTEIAIAKPFEGAPKINHADVFGASPNKPIILRVPVTGERPITYGAENLPEGLTLENGIITGKVAKEGVYTVTLTAENALGRDEKRVDFEIFENKVLLTPLLGFTSWNAFGPEVTQADIEGIAKTFVESGLSEYGYSYVNTDSGWQGSYGGKFDAIMPNYKFPDMKKMTDTIHSYGLKAGIYSNPMLHGFGCPDEFEWIPGCTQGEADIMFAETGTGIGTIRKEKNNAQQWEEWGFDYLKYDWYPCDPYNAELMRRELIKLNRDFGFCVTLRARAEYHKYWEKYCNSYRCNPDSIGTWENLLDIERTYFEFIEYINRGHYFDLDMMDIGQCRLFEQLNYIYKPNFGFTEDEQLIVYSIRAFMGSPIQISSTFEKLNEFELSMFCNEEIIAINQDKGGYAAKPYMIVEEGKKKIHVFTKKLADGSTAIAVFNLGETQENVKVYFDGHSHIRDVWAKKDMDDCKTLSIELMQPHTVRIFKVTQI